MKIILKEVKPLLDIPHAEPSIHLLSPDIVQIDIEPDTFDYKALLFCLWSDVIVH